MRNLLCSLLPILFFSVLAPCAVAAPAVEAYLYNPGADQLVTNYPYNRPPDISPLKASLNLLGSGFPDGSGNCFTPSRRRERVFTPAR